MIEKARRGAAALGLRNVTFVQAEAEAEAEALPFDDASFEPRQPDVA